MAMNKTINGVRYTIEYDGNGNEVSRTPVSTNGSRTSSIVKNVRGKSTPSGAGKWLAGGKDPLDDLRNSEPENRYSAPVTGRTISTQNRNVSAGNGATDVSTRPGSSSPTYGVNKSSLNVTQPNYSGYKTTTEQKRTNEGRYRNSLIDQRFNADFGGQDISLKYSKGENPMIIGYEGTTGSPELDEIRFEKLRAIDGARESGGLTAEQAAQYEQRELGAMEKSIDDPSGAFADSLDMYTQEYGAQQQRNFESDAAASSGISDEDILDLITTQRDDKKREYQQAEQAEIKRLESSRDRQIEGAKTRSAKILQNRLDHAAVAGNISTNSLGRPTLSSNSEMGRIMNEQNMLLENDIAGYEEDFSNDVAIAQEHYRGLINKADEEYSSKQLDLVEKAQARQQELADKQEKRRQELVDKGIDEQATFEDLQKLYQTAETVERNRSQLKLMLIQKGINDPDGIIDDWKEALSLKKEASSVAAEKRGLDLEKKELDIEKAKAAAVEKEEDDDSPKIGDLSIGAQNAVNSFASIEKLKKALDDAKKGKDTDYAQKDLQSAYDYMNYQELSGANAESDADFIARLFPNGIEETQ